MFYANKHRSYDHPFKVQGEHEAWSGEGARSVPSLLRARLNLDSVRGLERALRESRTQRAALQARVNRTRRNERLSPVPSPSDFDEEDSERDEGNDDSDDEDDNTTRVYFLSIESFIY